ncbi:gluconokinase [uncultured Sphingomonas sp.]|uniref:gluconokinase n=1 Tax=uncultured Sphingomonas sp. TaxID=158754 RepID=UPI0025F8B118|nr:gluconokinase [uncultured Sphingomonas sp.]
MAIIVMGVSGSGKSTLGTLIAEALHCPFLEGDAFHDDSAVARMRSGIPLTDEDRWPWLDRLGAAIGASVAAEGIAVAACSALRRSYRARLVEAIGAPTRFLLPDNDRQELARRLTSRQGHYMPPTLLESQLATLERPEPQEAALILDASAPPERLRDDALAWLRA